MRDKNGWLLSQQQTKRYLDAAQMLYGPADKGSSEIVPLRANLAVTTVPRGTSKPKPRKEWREQAEIYAWTQTVQTLQKMVMMIGNESRRTVVQAAVAKRMGLLAGSSDLFVALPVTPYAGLWLEVKQNRSYSMSERKKDSWLRQEAFQQRMRDVGYAARFCYGSEEGISIIKSYMKDGK